jgi:hypothetical protein
VKPAVLAEVAEAAEALTSPIVDARRRIIAPKGKRTRPIKTDAGRVVTHADLLQGLFERAAVEVAVVDGARPEWITCVDCGAVVKVPPVGGNPKRCKSCARRHRIVKATRVRPEWVTCADCGELSAAGLDQTAPPMERELGPRAARRTITEATAKIRAALAFAGAPSGDGDDPPASGPRPA